MPQEFDCMRRGVLRLRRNLDAEYATLGEQDAHLERLEEILEAAAEEWFSERGEVADPAWWRDLGRLLISEEVEEEHEGPDIIFEAGGCSRGVLVDEYGHNAHARTVLGRKGRRLVVAPEAATCRMLEA